MPDSNPVQSRPVDGQTDTDGPDIGGWAMQLEDRLIALESNVDQLRRVLRTIGDLASHDWTDQ